MSPVIILMAVSFNMIGPTSCTYRELLPTDMEECHEMKEICKNKGGYIIGGEFVLPIMRIHVQEEMEDWERECGCSISPEVYSYLETHHYDVDGFQFSVYDDLPGIREWLEENNIKFLPGINMEKCHKFCYKYGGYIIGGLQLPTIYILHGREDTNNGVPECECRLNSGVEFYLENEGYNVNSFKHSVYDGLPGIRK
nr:PREDICTED: uncharacterized protein LOC109033452 isoform X1 [Bemisia tabaci]